MARKRILVKTPLTVIVPSHRPKMAERTIKSVKPNHAIHIDGTNAPSFSWLVNQCVLQCPTERVVICSDKCYPTGLHLRKLNYLLNSGFGLVGLYRFGFFGFDKELFRRIGPMDERFIGGNCEDDDYINRLKEADIAYYESESVRYRPKKSSWDISKARSIYESKWRIGDELVRLLPEVDFGYDFGPSVKRQYKPWSKSVLLPFRETLRELPCRSELSN